MNFFQSFDYCLPVDVCVCNYSINPRDYEYCEPTDDIWKYTHLWQARLVPLFHECISPQKPKFKIRKRNFVSKIIAKPKPYSTTFKIKTKFSKKERSIQRCEKELWRKYGGEFWLHSVTERTLEPQVFEHVTGFVRDRIDEVKDVHEKMSVAGTAFKTIETIKGGIAYSASDPENFEENLICRIEDLVAFIVAVSNTTTLPAMLSTIHLFIRTYYTKSVTKTMMSDIMAILKLQSNEDLTNLQTQSGDDVEDTFVAIRSALTNWKEFRGGIFAQKLAQVVSIFVVYGFVGEQSNVSVKLMEMFNVRAWSTQKSSIDFTEMVIDTVMFFIERGYAAFKHNDLSMLLYSDTDIRDLDKEFALLVSALPLLESGNLSGLDKFDESIKDQSEYEVRVQKCNAKYASMLKVERSPPMRNVLTNRLVSLSKIRTALILCQKSSCVREKPFGLMIYGGSSVGKTMVNSIATKVCLHHNGFASGKESIVTLNDNDKYQSEYRAHHVAVTMDDFGNTRADKYEGSPTAKIIDFLNNVPKAALNPNVELKGNVMIQPKLVSVTTNVKHLMAADFSNEPVSILRRFELMFDVKIRPEFIDPKTGGLNREMMAGKFMPDAWLIDVNYVEILREKDENKADRYRFVPISENASIFEAMEILKAESKKHYTFQRSFVSSVEDMFNMELCEHSYEPSTCVHCLAAKKLETQSDEHQFVDPLSDFAAEKFDAYDRSMEDFVDDANFVDRAYKIAQDSLEKAMADKMEAAKVIACAALGLTASFFTVRAVYQLFRKLMPQGNAIQIPERLPTDAESPWKRVVSVPIPVSTASKTATDEQLVALIERSIGHMYVYDSDRSSRKMCDVVPMCNNYWLAPSHMFEDKEYEIEIQTTPLGVLGKNPTQIIGPEVWHRIPNTDFLLFCLTSGGDVTNIARYLPMDKFSVAGIHTTTIHKDAEGKVEKHHMQIRYDEIVDSGVGKFDGFFYRYPQTTFKGLCMMTMVSRTRKPFICGFHLAGYKNSSIGAGGKLTYVQLQSAITEIRKQRILEVHSSGTMPTSKFGIDFQPVGSAEPKSAVHWLVDEDDKQPIGEVYGPHPLGTRTFQSNVQKSPISDSVTRIMGLPKAHGKPKGMNSWKHWQRDLSLMSHPTGKFRPSLLKLAREDMNGMVDNFFDKQPDMIKLVHPYSHEAILAGVDGVNSVDRVDLSTSMGFPINKQKKNFVRESDIKIDGITCPLEMDDVFWNELDNMEKTLASGERIHTIFRGNLKDEATKLTKDKVRVFAGCEFMFTLLVRKYYLSIIRVIQTNWDDFECAVGINAHGPDWSRLQRKLAKYSDTRMIAGDYAAYDKRVCPEATLSAFDVMIRIAERAGYSEEQLTIMRGIATEICLPIYEYNGVFVKIFGSNPSGHPLTVIINNIQNSIYLRYAYYALHVDEKVPPFADVVSLICYGDDNAMSVADSETKFNHTSVSEELAKVGIKYTMADKLAESKPFIPLSEISFLKRGFIYDPNLKEWLAPIEELSISKSLHNYMNNRGSITLPEQIAGDAIKGANREFFLHGREKYEMRKSQLEQVRDENNLTTFVGELPSYGEMEDIYLDRKKDVRELLNPGVLILQ